MKNNKTNNNNNQKLPSPTTDKNQPITVTVTLRLNITNMCHSLIGHIDDTPTFSYNSTVKEIKMEYTSFVKTCIAIYWEIIQQTALCTSQLSQLSTSFTFYSLYEKITIKKKTSRMYVHQLVS